MYIVYDLGIVKCKLCKLENIWSKKWWWCTVKNTSVSSKEARVGVSPTGHSRSTSPIRRFDRIWFDCQPAFEIHTALDFKYPSYRGCKAGYQRLICPCRRRVFEIWQICSCSITDCMMAQACSFADATVWWIKQLVTVWCQISVNLSSPYEPDFNLVW